jgi:hypothetical protein
MLSAVDKAAISISNPSCPFRIAESGISSLFLNFRLGKLYQKFSAVATVTFAPF